MVALVKSNSVVATQKSQHARFLAMLPQIRRQALIAFRNQRFEVREELIQEVIANSYRAWVLLVRRGKESVVYPTPLAQYAIRQVRGGRRVGGRLNLQDILSPQARRHYGITIERIDRRDPQDGVWNEHARRRPKSRPGRNGGGASGFDRLAAHAVEAKSPDCEGVVVGGDDQCRGQAIRVERGQGQPVTRLAARALGAVSGRQAVGRMRVLNEPNVMPSTHNPACAGLRCRLGSFAF